MTSDSEKIMFEKLSAELGQTQKQVELLSLELREAQDKLHQLVYRDGLSGLYNLRYFHEMVSKELERSLRYSSPFSLIIFKLELFAEFNEKHGHENGDLVMMNIARIMQKEVRPSDIAARYGGEEFAVILPETNYAGVKTFAERLCESVQEMATLIEGHELKTTISLGGVTFLPGVSSANKRDIVHGAEQALADAKGKGPQQITITELPASKD